MTSLQREGSVRVRATVWIATAFVIAALSAGAVWALVAQYPTWLPRPLPAVLEWFVEPGVLVWWLTIGGLFEGYPSSPAGYGVVVVGNTVVWMTLAALVAFSARRMRNVR